MAWVISQRRRNGPRFFVSSDPRRGGVERSQNMLSGEWSSLIVGDICICLARPSLILSPLLVTESGDPSWSRSENHSGLFISTLSSGCHVLSTPSRVPHLTSLDDRSKTRYCIKGVHFPEKPGKINIFSSLMVFVLQQLHNAQLLCPRIHLQRHVKDLMDN